MPISAQSLELPDAHLRKALAYWQRKCGERHMPRRADIDPVEMPELLPYVRLVDVVAPGQYRYRLVGTELEQLHGGLKFAGRFVHEALPPPLADHVVPVYDECVRERRPVFLENTRTGSAWRVIPEYSFYRCPKTTRPSRWCW
jgi:PAS domain